MPVCVLAVNSAFMPVCLRGSRDAASEYTPGYAREYMANFLQAFYTHFYTTQYMTI